ncbi:hypothetical protein [Bacillus sp. T33-2]|uniref:hypothetical protein n=1 Tax=Bacillus sp. T33-2 TaxID=2054168 RepID=UPI000C769690|nr:hypothetical protein [Bacillus sp. T33-2]PLR99613.1 hypothetical protein CVD19_00695 [Bacillus sp. T33-2]
MNITFQDIENKNRIIDGMKKTLKVQSEKIERYEKALKEIAESDEDSSCNELALKYEVIAEQALNN